MKALYKDRVEAGARLAPRLGHLVMHDPLVLAIPDGGVPIAVAIGRELQAPVDVIVIDTGGGTRMRMDAEARMRSVGRAESMIGQGQSEAWHDIDRAQDELSQATDRLGHHDEMPQVQGRTVIVVDDGLSADTIVHAALRAVRMNGAQRIVLATPFLSRPSADLHESELNQLVALDIPEEYSSASDFYELAAPPDVLEARQMLTDWRTEQQALAPTA